MLTHPFPRHESTDNMHVSARCERSRKKDWIIMERYVRVTTLRFLAMMLLVIGMASQAHAALILKGDFENATGDGMVGWTNPDLGYVAGDPGVSVLPLMDAGHSRDRNKRHRREQLRLVSGIPGCSGHCARFELLPDDTSPADIVKERNEINWTNVGYYFVTVS